MVKRNKILIVVLFFIMLLTTFPVSTVKIADDNSKDEYGEHQIIALKTSEWKSGFNYSIIDNYPYSWIEINETGTEFTGWVVGDDDDGANYTSFRANGWNFTFYGTEYGYLNVSTNGWMTFSNPNDGWVYSYTSSTGREWDPIPQNCITTDHENHNDTVVLLGMDLDLGINSHIFYQFFGTAPNRYLVIEYFEVEEYEFDDLQTMEAIFYENGDIKFQYKNISDPDNWLYPDETIVGLDHGDLINYSNYTNDWNNTFGGAIEKLAVYFRLSKSAPIFLPSEDDDDDSEEIPAIPGFDLFLIIGSSLLALIIIAKKFKKNSN